MRELTDDGVVKPVPGDTVSYVSKIGDGVESPAVVLRTKDTTVKEVIDRWGPEPQTVTSKDGTASHETAARPSNVIADLPDDLTVDLLVHGLGKDYREYGVPFHLDDVPGTWHWRPERAEGV